MPRGVAKSDLPTKQCACCGRPFTWRKKWARDWEQVRYCSDACRQQAKKHGETKSIVYNARPKPSEIP